MRKQILLFVIASLPFTTIPLLGQPPLESAQANLYFPQFATGGQPAAQWQTTFTFSNPTSSTATCTLFLLNDGGQPLSINFGSGAISQVSFSVLPYRTRTFDSVVSPSAITTGWAITLCTTSTLQGVVTYRFLQNGVETSEISVPGTVPTQSYFSPANASLGIAIGNVYSSSIPVQVIAHGNDGSTKSAAITVPGLGHRSIALKDTIPGLSQAFTGTVELSGSDSYYFVAVTLRSDNGLVYSSLPSGNRVLPLPYPDRIRKVFNVVREVARGVIPSADTIQLTISSEKTVNAFGGAGGIQINMALAELIADSESELAWAIAHELGHVYQFRLGTSSNPKLEFHSNAEFDADTWGFLFTLASGYDPYAGAGTLAKLAMATGTAGLVTQFFEELSFTDAHKSFNTRLENIYTTIQAVCTASTELTSLCTSYHQTFHPHMPGALLDKAVSDVAEALRRDPPDFVSEDSSTSP